MSALVLLLVVIGSWVPGFVGTAAAAVLPWCGLALALVAVLALFSARRVLLVILLPALVWALAIFPSLPGFGAAPSADAAPLTVVSQNVRAQSGGAAASAAELAGHGADVIALTELDADSLTAARDALAAEYPYSYAIGTVAVWSRSPLANAQPLTLGLDWRRALRVEVQTPDAAVAVYVMHAASVRPGHQQDRDTMLSGIADAVASDPAESIIVVGDFNAASADPALGAIRSQLGLGAPDRRHPRDDLARCAPPRPHRPGLRARSGRAELHDAARGEQRPSRDGDERQRTRRRFRPRTVTFAGRVPRQATMEAWTGRRPPRTRCPQRP